MRNQELTAAERIVEKPALSGGPGGEESSAASDAGTLSASADSEPGADQASGEALGPEGDSAEKGDEQLPDMSPAPPDQAAVEAIMAKIVQDTVGDIPEVSVPPKKKKLNAFVKALLIFLAALVFACLVVYFYYAMSYRDKYLKGTYINGIDVSEMKPEDVEDYIRDKVEAYTLTLIFRDGEQEVLTNEDMGFHFVSDGGARRILEEQNIYAWFMGYFDRYWPHNVGEGYEYDFNSLEKALENLKELSGDYQKAPTDACLKREGDYIVIEPETEGNTVVFERLVELAQEAVGELSPSVDLRDYEDTYLQPTILSDNSELNLQMNDLNGFCDNRTVLHLPDGTTRVLERSTLIDWLSVDASGYYYINVDELRTHCAQYVAGIAAEADVTYNTRVFHSTNFGDINFNSAPWGYTIDQAAETERLFNDLCAKISSDREPAYSLNKQYDDTFGGTYIEVDITYQRVYYYENGERVIAADCVTGTDNADRHTVTGIFSIYNMETDRTLLGQPDENGDPSYSSFVNYWMAFYGGYGLHDASWRSSFGGSIYKYSGSHGCVNLPYSVARKLYYSVDVGTPVIVFKM